MGYEVYGLRENPFPRVPILAPESRDPRENGSIFCVNARAAEIKAFEEKYIGTKTSFDDRFRAGFLWAEGGRTSGRGMGKTALGIYMKHKINDGYGKNYFGGSEKIFCSYISFPKELKAKIDFVYRASLRAFIKEGLFAHVQSTSGKAALTSAGVGEELSAAIVGNQGKEYLEGLSRYSLEVFSTAWDTKFLTKLPDLFLNQTVRALETAGFKGGILLIDDVENLTDKSTPREVEPFIKDFGNAFFRAGYEARNFFTLVLTTHDQSAQKISQAWTVAGLSAAFPLSERSQASILVPKPDMGQCIDIVAQYLQHYRKKEYKPPSNVHPFGRSTVEGVIEEAAYHPRRFLGRFNRLVVEALSAGISEITPEFAKTVPELKEEETLPGIERL